MIVVKELNLSSRKVRQRTGEADEMYSLRKSFSFRTRSQSEAFSSIAEMYCRTHIFGTVVICEAALPFHVWRKMSELAEIVAAQYDNYSDIYEFARRAGFKAFSASS